MNAKEVKAALEDEDLAMAVQKEVAKATKAKTRQILAVIKEAAESNRETEDRAVKKAVAEALKSITTGIKEVA